MRAAASILVVATCGSTSTVTPVGEPPIPTVDRAACWGFHSAGELGDGSILDLDTPAAVH